MNKLVEISAGKWSYIKKDKEQGLALGGPKSLNMGYRKKETDRIENENHAFAKRLFDKQANLNKKKLDQEFQNHLKYKKQIQRVAPASKNKTGNKKSVSTVRQSKDTGSLLKKSQPPVSPKLDSNNDALA